MKIYPANKHGFTLVEISIVLVIIGLLVGSVLAGYELIIAAQIRATISQKERFDVASQTFRAKYNCLPGDCANATAAGFTGNGDGDGVIGYSIPEISGYAMEVVYFWEHLKAAGLIDSNFTRVTATPISIARQGDNVPGIRASAAPDAGWSFWCEEGFSLSTAYKAYPNWRPVNAYAIVNTTVHPNGSNGDVGGALRPAIAQVIDQKIDDGFPTTGQVRGLGGYGIAVTADTCQPYTYTDIIGPGGASSNFCISDSTTPYQYNIRGGTTSCYLIMKSSF